MLRINIRFCLVCLAAALGLTPVAAVPPAADRDPSPGRSGSERTGLSTNSNDRLRTSGADKNVPAANPPETPREWLNAGTRHLNEGKLREAEVCLENALFAQAESIQPAALYNAGHVRFRQGIEEIKKGPVSATALSHGRTADAWGERAVQVADDALQSNVIEKMVQAYIRGRGTRRELRRATEAVKQALEAHSAGLLKWQRASGDFHSAAELAPADRDARHNAEVVDRHIARLIDTIRKLQEASSALGKQSETLREKLKQLKGRIPQQDMPPGAGEEEEDEEEQGQKMPEEGQQEPQTKTGMEIELTPEQAAWLLEGFRLDRERRLPMGQEQQTDPKDPNRPTW